MSNIRPKVDLGNENSCWFNGTFTVPCDGIVHVFDSSANFSYNGKVISAPDNRMSGATFDVVAGDVIYNGDTTQFIAYKEES